MVLFNLYTETQNKRHIFLWSFEQIPKILVHKNPD